MITTSEQKHEIKGAVGDGLEGAAAYAGSVDEPITVRPTPAAVFSAFKAAELVVWHFKRYWPVDQAALEAPMERLAEAIGYDDDAATARHLPAVLTHSPDRGGAAK